MAGENVNRRTANNVVSAELAVERDEPIGMRGIFRLIAARRPWGGKTLYGPVPTAFLDQLMLRFETP